MNPLPPVGAHITSPRKGYVHHGIHVGAGRVVHYAGFAHRLSAGPVEEVSLETFAGTHGYSVMVHADAAYLSTAAAERARSRLGENRYHLLRNNCEHLALWCVTGRHASRQAETWIARLARIRMLWRQCTDLGWQGRRA